MKRSEPRIGDLGRVDPHDTARRAPGGRSRAAPAAALAGASPQDGGTTSDAPRVPSLFGFRGRLPRLRFVVHLGASLSLPAALLAVAVDPVLALWARAPAQAVALASSSLTLVLIWQLASACRRLHDLGLRGWPAAAVLLPGLNLLLFALLALVPGQRGANRFGPPPTGNHLLVWLGYLLFVLVPIGLAPAAALSYESHLQAQQAAVPPAPLAPSSS